MDFAELNLKPYAEWPTDALQQFIGQCDAFQWWNLKRRVIAELESRGVDYGNG
jgi:hypothetical protein